MSYVSDHTAREQPGTVKSRITGTYAGLGAVRREKQPGTSSGRAGFGPGGCFPTLRGVASGHYVGGGLGSVTTTQQALKNAGFLADAVDGQAGTNTMNAQCAMATAALKQLRLFGVKATSAEILAFADGTGTQLIARDKTDKNVLPHQTLQKAMRDRVPGAQSTTDAALKTLKAFVNLDLVPFGEGVKARAPVQTNIPPPADTGETSATTKIVLGVAAAAVIAAELA